MTRVRLLALAAVAALASTLALWPETGVRLVTVALCAEGPDYQPEAGGDPARCRTAVCVLRREPTAEIPDLRGEARLIEDLGTFADPNPEGPPLDCWKPSEAPPAVRTAYRAALRSVCRNTIDAGLCRIPGGDGGALVPAPYETTLPRATAVGTGCVPMPSGCPKEQTDLEGLNSCFPLECRR